jgi:hypothetical protein
VFDSALVPEVFDVDGNTLVLDLADYAIATSVQPVYLIADDAEHPDGQVLVDNVDCVVQIAFRSVITSGTLPPPDYDAATAALAAHIASLTPHATLGNISSLSFNQTAGITVAEGQMAWNTVDKTVDLGLPSGSVLQIGQELLVRVVNKTGATIPDMRAVYITGAQGDRVTIGLATANATGGRTLAITTQTIANNAEGLATVVGLVRNVDTSAFAEGAEIWVSPSTPGALVSPQPEKPNRSVLVGYCVRSHATVGILFVAVRFASALSILSDLLLTSPTNRQAIMYDAASQTWKNQPVFPVVADTGATSLVGSVSDIGAYLRFTNTDPKSYTVAPQSAAAWVANTEVRGRNVGAGDLTLTAGVGVILNAPLGGSLVVPQHGVFTLRRVAQDVWDVS